MANQEFLQLVPQYTIERASMAADSDFLIDDALQCGRAAQQKVTASAVLGDVESLVRQGLLVEEACVDVEIIRRSDADINAALVDLCG